MADEATPQETTTENAPAETVEAPADAVKAPVSGGDVQATETDKADESVKDEKPAKSYDEAYVKKLRDEAAAARVKGKEAAEKARQEAAEAAEKALTEKWAKALGLVKDDDEPADPAELLKQAEEREKQLAQERDSYAERLRNYARKDAITDAARAADGDLDSILDSRKVISEIEKLDTTADDFAAQVEAIVKDAVDSNPKLKKAVDRASAPRSGGDLSGGNAAPKPRGPKTVDDFRREYAERNKR
nr:hypothetical protein [Nocardia wallacei]